MHLVIVHGMYAAVKQCLPSICLAVDTLLSFNMLRACVAAAPALT